MCCFSDDSDEIPHKERDKDKDKTRFSSRRKSESRGANAIIFEERDVKEFRKDTDHLSADPLVPKKGVRLVLIIS